MPCDYSLDTTSAWIASTDASSEEEGTGTLTQFLLVRAVVFPTSPPMFVRGDVVKDKSLGLHILTADIFTLSRWNT